MCPLCPVHVAPHTGAHVDLRGCVATCQVPAPPVRHLATRGPPVALPRGLSAASHQRGGPARHVSARQHSRSPHHHLQVNTHFFQILNKKILNKNPEIHKNVKKFIFLKIQLLFNPNFLHWITNSFLFNIMSFKIYF